MSTIEPVTSGDTQVTTVKKSAGVATIPIEHPFAGHLDNEQFAVVEAHEDGLLVRPVTETYIRRLRDPDEMPFLHPVHGTEEIQCPECGAVAERVEEWVAEERTDELLEHRATGFDCTECYHVQPA